MAFGTTATTHGRGRWAGFPRISSNPAFNSTDPQAFFSNDSLFPADQAHDYISPHIQVSFPVTDRTNFRFSYAHQVQAPDFGVVLQGINTDVNITNTNNFYGSDLDFGRTITFEFGIRHAFSDDMVLDIAAYNKDNLSNAAGRLVTLQDPLKGIASNIRVITNADFGNTRGVDIRLDRRFGNIFNGTVAYTYANSKNTGSDPDTYLDFGSRVLDAVSGGNSPPPQAILPTDFDRPHNVAIAAAFNFPGDWQKGTAIGTVLQNVGLFTTFRYTSGTPYTPCAQDAGDETVVSGNNCNRTFPEPLNSSRLPAFKNLDIRLTKGFGLGKLDLTGYFEARNVLNWKNIVQVFTTTNDVTNSREEVQNFAADQRRPSRGSRCVGRPARRWYHRPELRRRSGSTDRLRRVGQAGQHRRQLPTAWRSFGPKSGMGMATTCSISASREPPATPSTTRCAGFTTSRQHRAGSGSAWSSTSKAARHRTGGWSLRPVRAAPFPMKRGRDAFLFAYENRVAGRRVGVCPCRGDASIGRRSGHGHGYRQAEAGRR